MAFSADFLWFGLLQVLFLLDSKAVRMSPVSIFFFVFCSPFFLYLVDCFKQSGRLFAIYVVCFVENYVLSDSEKKNMFLFFLLFSLCCGLMCAGRSSGPEGRRHDVLRADGGLGPDGSAARACASRETEGRGGQALFLEGQVVHTLYAPTATLYPPSVVLVGFSTHQ